MKIPQSSDPFPRLPEVVGMQCAAPLARSGRVQLTCANPTSRSVVGRRSSQAMASRRAFCGLPFSARLLDERRGHLPKTRVAALFFTHEVTR